MRSSGFRRALGFSAAAAVPAVGYVAVSRKQTPVPERVVPVVSQLPAGATVRLYQYESCPFCRKVRATLDYSGVPYEIQEVHPLTKRETKPFAPDYPKVPIITAGEGEAEVQIRNSSDIVRALLASRGLERAASAAPRWTPQTAVFWEKGGLAEEPDVDKRWVLWADQVLVQLVVLNIYRSLEESKETFRYLLTHPDFTAFERWSTYWSGVLVMRVVCHLRTRKYKLEDARSPFFEAVEMVAEEAKDGFLGGAKPSAADFNVFGVLRSLESFTTERLMLENTKIGPWYSRMAEMHAARGEGSKLRGAFRTSDSGPAFFPAAAGVAVPSLCEERP